MARRRPDSDPTADLRVHLEQLDAPALRDLFLATSGELPPASYARLVDAAARKVIGAKGRGALRAPKDPSLATDVTTFAKAMKTAARADPSRLDDLLARLNAAWTRGEHDVFRAAMNDITDALDHGVDLGHDELYSEVLSTDVHELSQRLLVSVYLTTPPGERAAAIGKANDAMDIFMATEDQPIRAMEEVALEPLPDLDEFARAWAAHLRAMQATGRANGSWALEQQLREATIRSAGTAGLAELARASKTSDDYEAWAQSLLSAGDPPGAGRAAREGAAAMSEGFHRARLYTLAARIEVGRKKDCEPDLNAAFAAEPSALHLRRWLASMPTKRRKHAVRDLELRSEDAAVTVIVDALRGDWSSVAKRIEKGAPLGWSGQSHAGQPGTDAVVWSLGTASSRVKKLAKPSTHDVPGLDDPGAWLDEDIAGLDGLATLPAPSLPELLDALAPSMPTITEAKALRDVVTKAALARVAAVAAQSRRSRYDDAGRLVAFAAALHDEAGETKAAAAVITKAREATGRKWSFTAAIDEALTRPVARRH